MLCWKWKAKKMKDKGKAYLFALFGFQQFYLGRTGRGLTQVCTLHLFGLWWVYDIFTLGKQVKRINHDYVLKELELKYRYAETNNKGEKVIRLKSEVYRVFADDMKVKPVNGYLMYKDAKVQCGE